MSCHRQELHPQVIHLKRRPPPTPMRVMIAFVAIASVQVQRKWFWTSLWLLKHSMHQQSRTGTKRCASNGCIRVASNNKHAVKTMRKLFVLFRVNLSPCL